MMTTTRKEYIDVDRFRVIAAILIVTIHTSPLANYSETADFILTRILARVAVPFFFMASGFFMFSQAKENASSRKLAAFTEKAALLYLVATLLYLPVNLYAKTWQRWLYLPSLLQDIVFNGTFYHLWYLPAAIIGACIVWFLRKRLKTRPVLLVCLLLYTIGLLGDSYYGITTQIPLLKTTYQALFSVFSYTRNGLFFAPIFLMLGAAIREQQKPLPLRVCLAGLGASGALLLTEGLLLHHLALQRHDSMYVMLIPCMFFLFQCLLYRVGKSQRILRDLSMLIYLIHPMMIVAVRGLAKILGLQALFIDNSLVHFLAVLIFSTAASFVLAVILQRLHKHDNAPAHTGRAWVEINMPSLQHNLQALRGALPQQCQVMAVVKASAYGHGDIEISRYLNRHGVHAFAVATLDEGIRLRQQGVKGEILILGYTPLSRAAELHHYRLSQTLVDAEYARDLDSTGIPQKAHIAVNTGMNRLGEDASHVDEIAALFDLQHLQIEGIFTHLCAPDSTKQEDIAFTGQQIKAFYTLLEQLKAKQIQLPKIHIQSSYGVLNYPNLPCDYARIGIALYGVLSQPEAQNELAANLEPVLALKSRVALVRTIQAGESAGYGRAFTARETTKIAIVSIGFADGLPRNLSSGKGSVLIRGRYAPIVGRICMDQCMIDVTEIPEVGREDIVTLIGKDGSEEIRAEQVAAEANTITNELLSRLGSRLERVFLA